jgi:hypothetical protein
LNNLEIDGRSAFNIDHIEDVHQSILSMVPGALDTADSRLLHLVAIFRGDLPRRSLLQLTIQHYA